MLGYVVDVSYPDYEQRGVRDCEVIAEIERHAGRLCNRHHAIRGPGDRPARKIRAFFEQKINSDGYVQDMTKAGIDIEFNTPGLYVVTKPLVVGGRLNAFDTRIEDGADYDGPCETCGATPEVENSTRCNQCYEVERYLHTYIESPAGRTFVSQTLLNWSRQ